MSINIIRPSKVEKRFPRLKDGLHQVALGNMTSFEVAVLQHGDGVVIGVIGKGCYTFSGYASSGYVSEKMKLGEGDAGNLADFINDQNFNHLMTRQGQYEYPDLLAK